MSQNSPYCRWTLTSGLPEHDTKVSIQSPGRVGVHECVCTSHLVHDLLTIPLIIIILSTLARVWNLVLPVLVTEQAAAVELNTTEEEN